MSSFWIEIVLNKSKKQSALVSPCIKMYHMSKVIENYKRNLSKISKVTVLD